MQLISNDSLHAASQAFHVPRLVIKGPSVYVSDWLQQPAESASKHREFLRWIPLHNITTSLLHQRKVILYGARARETPEAMCEKEMRREIRAVLPLVFGGVSSAVERDHSMYSRR